jgi:dihydrofolate synthase/folylpolyglutamate synthase
VTGSTPLEAWLAHVEGQHSSNIALGLDRVAGVATRLGLLPAPVPVVLVGGTNGKGSTLGFLEGALAAAGHRVGAYTSPHLFRFNERVRLGGTEVGDEPLVEAFERVESAREGVSLTYFEFTTLAAMVVFAEQADLILLEVGLGGRLDAVNIWEPAVSVVTSVALDHQAFLGDDREQIGREKAGIFRPGIPAVCGDPEPPASIRDGGGEDLWILERDFRIAPGEDGEWWWQGPEGELGPLPRPRLAGAYQLRNAATAVAAGNRLPPALRPGTEHWRAALPKVGLPGRAQFLPGPPPVWLDVAHNPAAAAELARMLAEQPVPGRTLAVFGAMGDKAVTEIRDLMAPVIDRWYPCAIPGERGLSGREMATRLADFPVADTGPFPDVATALAEARADARPGLDRIAVFGSFLMVAAALEILAPESPPATALDAVEKDGQP